MTIGAAPPADKRNLELELLELELVRTTTTRSPSLMPLLISTCVEVIKPTCTEWDVGVPLARTWTV
jgi:hypothetical protein